MTAILLDVSALEAPQPLQRAIEAALGLEAGGYLHMHHRMEPLHLYPWLERNGFDSLTREGPGGACEVFIWRRDDRDAAHGARAAAARLAPWRG